MLEVYCSEEIKRDSRIVYQNADWVVVVPYWATWPYQLLLLPKFNIKKMAQLNQGPVQKIEFIHGSTYKMEILICD